MCEIKSHVLPIRGAAVDPPPHRQRERYSARYSILTASSISRRRRTWRRSRPATGRAAATSWRARKRHRCWTCCDRRHPRLRPLPHHAQRERGRQKIDDLGGAGARAGARESRAQLYTHGVWKVDRTTSHFCRCAPTRMPSMRSGSMPT
jgi:hypothetical protein